jgi:hypothetical protein
MKYKRSSLFAVLTIRRPENKEKSQIIKEKTHFSVI